jgi:DNA-binding response OmpR family regulator
MFVQAGCPITPCPSIDIAVRLLSRHPFRAIFILYPPSLLSLIDDFAQVRQFGIPTYAITKSQSGLDRVRALKEGLTNYYIEPFSYAGVVREAVQAVYSVSQKTDIRECGDVIINYTARTISFDGNEIFLSKTLFLFVTMFVTNPKQVFSRVQFWEHVWGYASYPLTNTIDAHIGRLRRLLPPTLARRIQSVHGVGYRYVTED